MGYELDGRGREFSLPHGVQTGSRVHPASYSQDTELCFPTYLRGVMLNLLFTGVNLPYLYCKTK
jgi:hypothetical protein